MRVPHTPQWSCELGSVQVTAPPVASGTSHCPKMSTRWLMYLSTFLWWRKTPKGGAPMGTVASGAASGDCGASHEACGNCVWECQHALPAAGLGHERRGVAGHLLLHLGSRLLPVDRAEVLGGRGVGRVAVAAASGLGLAMGKSVVQMPLLMFRVDKRE